MIESCFIPFEQDVSSIEIPRQFTFPFYYSPHPLSIAAAEQLQRFIESQPWNDLFSLEGEESTSEGIMFGVLVVQKTSGEIGYLAGFSGKLDESNHHPGFVPPVFDILTEDGVFKQGEKEIVLLNQQIEALESAEELKDLLAHYDQLVHRSTQELEEARRKVKAGKQARKVERLDAKTTMDDEEYEKFTASLVKQSLDQQYDYKRLLKQWRATLAEVKAQVDAKQDSINELRAERKQRSAALQKTLFENYEFLNQNGETKNLLDIFSSTSSAIPPAGAGECAAPKLLHYAYKHELKPLALAEFWWGKSSNSNVRKHKEFYPSCRSKCEPILGHMLQGLDVEPNILLEKLAEEKELTILYEDDFLIAVNKPADFLSVPGKEVEDSVLTRMKEKYPEADGPLVVHRLDMSTSGVMLVAKSKEVHKLIQQQFEQRTIKKAYVALLDADVTEDRGEINLPLRVDYADRPRQLVCYDHGKNARTFWELIERQGDKSLVRFFPVTGRTHQLRVHAAHIEGLNAPIHGDELYGTRSNRLHLHAEQLKFVHPITKKSISIKAEVPF